MHACVWWVCQWWECGCASTTHSVRVSMWIFYFSKFKYSSHAEHGDDTRGAAPRTAPPAPVAGHHWPPRSPRTLRPQDAQYPWGGRSGFPLLPGENRKNAAHIDRTSYDLISRLLHILRLAYLICASSAPPPPPAITRTPLLIFKTRVQVCVFWKSLEESLQACESRNIGEVLYKRIYNLVHWKPLSFLFSLKFQLGVNLFAFT